MPLEFVFTPVAQTQWDELHQGDILIKTDELSKSLAQAHPYYADAEDYTYFMVLTQSCDLVFRGTRKPRSRYISLAAVRPLSLVVDRLLQKYRFEYDFPLSICAKEREILVTQTLERLLHNSEEGYFFLKGGSHPNIKTDLCVFLPLSVALQINHFKACLSSKVAQLDHIFQAKVGWLTGNLYSRIGTPDLEEHENNPEAFKTTFYEDAIYHRTAWLTGSQLKRLKALVTEWKRKNAGQNVTQDVARELIQQIPEPIDMVAERAVERLVAEDFIPDDPEIRTRATNLLRNDNSFRKLVSESPR